MKSAPEILKAYEEAPERPSTRVDPVTWMILVLAIYDNRNGEWIHDFLVREDHLPAAECAAHKSQLRKVHRWRAAVELEIGLPRRGRGKATSDYHRKRRLWENANPRPTPEMLMNGWYPVRVNYDQETPETKKETPVETTPETDGRMHITTSATPQVPPSNDDTDAYSSLPRNPDNTIDVDAMHEKRPKPTNLEIFRV